MKKTIRILAIVMTVVMLCVTLASCGKKLSGDYTADIFGTGTTLSFKGSKVTVIMKAFNVEVASVEGTYKIEDDKITFDFVDEDKVDDEDAKAILADFKGTLNFEEGDDFIKIAGVKYKKADK